MFCTPRKEEEKIERKKPPKTTGAMTAHKKGEVEGLREKTIPTKTKRVELEEKGSRSTVFFLSGKNEKKKNLHQNSVCLLVHRELLWKQSGIRSSCLFSESLRNHCLSPFSPC